MTTRHVLFIMSDTGGGHRAAAEAIRDALWQRYGQDQVEAELLDVFRECIFPYKYAPDLYPWVINHIKQPYGLSFALSNTPRRAKWLSEAMYRLNADRLRQIALQKPADVVVCVHSILTRPTLRAFQTASDQRPPFVTVVTDLVSTHAFWYHAEADMTLVPTQSAFERGLHLGISAEKMRITGLPVNPQFVRGLIGKAASRASLGWHPDKPTILMVSGGDGLGPLYSMACAIDAQQLDCQLAIVAGRNRALRERLEAVDWQQPTYIYPFVTNMPQLMDAADLIVTKAGPATVTEAAIAGLPMILMDAIPNQEDGNVRWVVENDAGVFERDPHAVGQIVARWIQAGPDALARRATNATRIARPEAVWEIADEVMQWAAHGPITNTPRPSTRPQKRTPASNPLRSS